MAVGCLRFAMGFIRRCRRALILAAVLWAGFALMVIIEDNPSGGKHALHRAAQIRAEGFVRNDRGDGAGAWPASTSLGHAVAMPWPCCDHAMAMPWLCRGQRSRRNGVTERLVRLGQH